MTDLKIVFEHWRVLKCSYMKRGKPDEFDLVPYSRKKRFMDPDKLFAISKYDRPASRGGKTVCHILKDGVEIACGEALCSMSDNFCYKTGREIAEERAIDAMPLNVRMEILEGLAGSWTSDP